MIAELVTRLRYRYVPDHVVGELLGRKWVDNAIPVFLLVAVTAYMAAAIPNFLSLGSIVDTSRQIGEFGLIVIGMAIVMLTGGIDLSVGSNFALANFTALALINVAKWPTEAAIVATIGVGALVGLINGLLIGYLRLRAFLTTLVTLTLIRAVVEFLLQIYSVQIASSDVSSDLFDFVGAGSVLGVPLSLVVLIVIAIVAHVVMTRLRIGWRIAAVGGSRRAAYNAGIPVRRTVCLSYVVSGMLTGLAGVLYAARLSGVGPDTGVGLELTVATAALLGGNSFGGGRGSIGKALMGAVIVSVLINGLVRLGVQTGASAMVVGLGVAAGDRHRRALGQMAKEPPIEGLCVAGLSGFAARSALRPRRVYALRDERPPRRRRDHWSGPDRRTRRRHSRQERQHLRQCAARRHRPLSRSRLRPT